MQIIVVQFRLLQRSGTVIDKTFGCGARNARCSSLTNVPSPLHMAMLLGYIYETHNS